MKNIKNAICLMIFFFALTGFIYPLLMTGLAQLFFKDQANGNMISFRQKIVGSKWIGQCFTDEKYFWGRPSATSPLGCNALNSSGSNLGPTNPEFFKIVKSRAEALRTADPLHQLQVPVELVTASASGLDPDISPEAAYYQIPRIAAKRHLPFQVIQALIDYNLQARSLDILGEPRVNILQLNIALDIISQGALYNV